MAPMNEDIRNEWTDKLRDPAYPQGTGCLNQRNQRYCCWGVLCEVAVEHNVMRRNVSLHGAVSYEMIDNDDRGEGKAWAFPPASLLEWAGIDKEAGPSSHIVSHLAAMNDNGSNFSVIAEEIEQYLGR